jgi:Zn-dependent M16 (insulinase) family peptidase
VSEYGAYCTRYIHKKSGAEILSVSNDDDNKVFGITLRTPPSDSTGVPHILEHSVLCGSRKFKTKDPFVQLLQGSLQTFLNAFTYPDRTCYVLASQNQKDFYNLIHVYTDAVFHPRAVNDPRVLAQEGWHLELENKDDPLTYKGVVYNEMKGVYSSPDSLLNRESQRSLFPDNAYSVDSGGDPVDIPNLSFQQFVDFHGKFYHPSNAKIFFYGDDDVETRLKIMDEYLAEFSVNELSRPSSAIQWQQRSFASPKWESHYFPVSNSGSMEDGPDTHMLNVNWLLNDRPLTSTEDLTLSVLNHLLLGTPQSILYKTLMESGLGTAVTGGGLSDELLQATFSVGLKGIAKDNVGKVQDLILETLKKVAEEGFDKDDIAASMNTIEFRLREFNTGSFPRGLSLMLGAMAKWNYDNSPTQALKFEKPLEDIKEMISQSGSKVFKDMIHAFLLNNNHRVSIEMIPSKSLEEQQLQHEKDRLASIKSSLSSDELDTIILKTTELKEMQAAEDSTEARATIPKLGLNDLKREVTEYPIQVNKNQQNSGVTVITHELASTSGIAYVNFAVDISDLSLDDIVLLPLFTRLLEEAGTSQFSDIEIGRRIGMHTGGIDISTFIRSVRPNGVSEGVIHDGSHMITKIMFKGKATSDKIGELFSIMSLLLTDSKLDSQKKVIEMLKETKASLESRIQGSGHSFANTRIKSRYRFSSYIDEIMSGITYLETVNSLLSEAEKDWASLLVRLNRMRATILAESKCRDGMFLDITAEKKVLDTIQPAVTGFLSSLPGKPNVDKFMDFYEHKHPWVAQSQFIQNSKIEDEGFIVPTQVNYVGKGGELYSVGEKVSGASTVVSRFLRTGYLWDFVRVIGGAYGGFCTFGGDGLFTFLSYRDPNLGKTLDVYDNAAEALLESVKMLENDPEMLATSIIGAIGDMDGAFSADQKGFMALNRWIARESPEQRQRFRDEVLSTTISDFVGFADRLKSMSNVSSAVVSSSSAFNTAASEGKAFKLKQVL